MKQDTLFCPSFIFYATVLFSNAPGPNGPHFFLIRYEQNVLQGR